MSIKKDEAYSVVCEFYASIRINARHSRETATVKDVILHLGLHKTGSTSIQAALHGFAQDKVKTVSFAYDNHSIPMYTIFSSRRHNYHIWKNVGYDERTIDRVRDGFLSTLNAEMDDKNFETLMISGEDLSILEPQDIKDMAAFSREMGVG